MRNITKAGAYGEIIDVNFIEDWLATRLSAGGTADGSGSWAGEPMVRAVYQWITGYVYDDSFKDVCRNITRLSLNKKKN